MHRLRQKTLTLLLPCAECIKILFMGGSSKIILTACYNFVSRLACRDLWSSNKMAFMPSKSHSLMDTVIHNKTTCSSLKIRTNYTPTPSSVWQLTLCISLERLQDYSKMSCVSTFLLAGKESCILSDAESKVKLDGCS